MRKALNPPHRFNAEHEEAGLDLFLRCNLANHEADVGSRNGAIQSQIVDVISVCHHGLTSSEEHVKLSWTQSAWQGKQCGLIQSTEDLQTRVACLCDNDGWLLVQLMASSHLKSSFFLFSYHLNSTGQLPSIYMDGPGEKTNKQTAYLSKSFQMYKQLLQREHASLFSCISLLYRDCNVVFPDA